MHDETHFEPDSAEIPPPDATEDTPPPAELEATEVPAAASLPSTDEPLPDEHLAAAHALGQQLAAAGYELPDEVALAEVPGDVLAALRDALAAQAGPRPSVEEQRRELAERIARSHRLPRGMRERLSGMVETVRFDDTGREEPALRVSDAVALLEETLPSQVLLSPDDVEAVAHPRGDSFFTGDARHLSDDDARRIAAGQLARTGYGSRVHER